MENIIDKIFNNSDEIMITSLLDFLGSDFNVLIEYINQIDYEKLYPSIIHGYNHSIKVVLFSYILCKMYNVNSIDMQIALDAAAYHDIGRCNDDEDLIHGENSAELIEPANLNKSIVYNDIINLKLLKAVITAHSLDDKDKDLVYSKYFNEDVYSRYTILWKILKDADALDRTRFINDKSSMLDPKFLRLNDSHLLINFSELINKKIYESNNITKKLV